MKRYVAVFGVGAGAFVALGQLSAAQWHAAGVVLLAIVLRYGLVVLPWILSALLAVLWRKEYKRAELYGDIAIAEQETRQRLGAQLWKAHRALEQQPAQRRRTAR